MAGKRYKEDNDKEIKKKNKPAKIPYKANKSEEKTEKKDRNEKNKEENRKASDFKNEKSKEVKENLKDDERATTKRQNKYKIKYVNPSKHKPLKVIGIILLILVVVIVMLLGAAYFYIKNKLSKMNYQEIDKNEVGINEQTKNSMSDYTNIALLGVDSLSDDFSTDFRTDCIMIASINNRTNEVTLWSIYRDTYVQMDLDGKTILNKINQAYYDGVQNTLKTINQNLDLNISEYALASFGTVKDAVDELGGIELNITDGELKYINSYIDGVTTVTEGRNAKHAHITKTGTQHVDGVEAMAYCRIRYDGLDYKRTERMRTVLQKIADKLKTKNISEINEFANKMLPEIQTNITQSEITSLIPKLISLNVKDSFGWPYETTGVWFANYPGDKSDFYGPANTLESNVLELHQKVFEQYDYKVPDSIKEISNKIIEKTGVGKQ